MSKWIRGNKPEKEGYYWVTDGQYAFQGYYHLLAGWGIFEGTKCIKIDDMNFCIVAYAEQVAPKGYEKFCYIDGV